MILRSAAPDAYALYMKKSQGELLLPNGRRVPASYILSQHADRFAGQVIANLSDVDPVVLWSGVTLITAEGRPLKILMTALSDRGAPFVGLADLER